MSPVGDLALFVIGFIAAVINVIAAGGSFLTLPLLLFLGLPASVANGTNRMGVLAQNLTAVVGFHRHEVLPVMWANKVTAPAVVGASLGVWAALKVPEIAFRRILSIVMLAMTLGTLLHKSMRGERRPEPQRPGHWTMMGGCFMTGLYGGFLQAGVGFLALAMTSLAGFDLVRGNAVKVFTVMLLTVLTLAVFAGSGHVDWPASRWRWGACLAASSACASRSSRGTVAGARGDGDRRHVRDSALGDGVGPFGAKCKNGQAKVQNQGLPSPQIRNAAAGRTVVWAASSSRFSTGVLGSLGVDRGVSEASGR